MWLVASLEKTWTKLAYSNERKTLGFACLVVIASSVAVVSSATMREFERKCV